LEDRDEAEDEIRRRLHDNEMLKNIQKDFEEK